MGEIQSYGFSPDGFSQIVVFGTESQFKDVIAANPHMTAIMGADDYTRENFPGVFMAGVKASLRADAGRVSGKGMQYLVDLADHEFAASISIKGDLGKCIDTALGEDKAKAVLEDLAQVVAKHNLVQMPEVCEMLFRYMISVTRGWNDV